ncbi:hypothetical protein GLYMA_04G101251v4 [Glycine max]|nr:hypothetical protein GLYMA_04G101251v4 [Glycine max]KAH1110745.1 hypothetical protein GYH30_009515 [Glycine max]
MWIALCLTIIDTVMGSLSNGYCPLYFSFSFRLVCVF